MHTNPPLAHELTGVRTQEQYELRRARNERGNVLPVTITYFLRVSPKSISQKNFK
jgi:hypothetical protein